ncbi:MAG: hypothetical protein GX856_13930 [Gammaproteobacteria bacterium]|nr:hypothetical protein [Gammaproteobacteria bacterium]
MASIKSAATKDREQSERIVKRETLASLRAQLAEVRRERDFFRANSLRKEGVIQMLQKKVERLEGGAAAAPAGERIDFAAAAQAYCAAHGVSSVSRADLVAWCKEQARAAG